MATISSLGIGSGLDLNGLLDQLKSAEREKLAPITQQQQSYQSQISAYGRLESSLSQFQDAAAKLNDAEFFQGVTSEVTGSAVTAAGGTDAAPGRYDINVTKLARAQSLAANGVDDSTRALNSAAGTLTLSVGGGAGTDIAIAADSSLEDVRDSINASGAGIQASIVNDGDAANPYRLVLTSEATGTESEMDVSYSDPGSELGGLMDYDSAGGAGGSMTQSVAAEDAALSVNGISISSQSNTVEGAVQGVTLSLAETGTATLAVERDNGAVESAVKGFVDSYNKLQSKIADLTSFNAETGDAGELLGDGTLRSVESQLRNALGGSAGDGTFKVLSDVGISLQVDGSLELDEKALGDAIDNDLAALGEFFTGADEAGGMAGQVDAVLGRMLEDGGLIANSTKGLEDSIERLGERYTRTEENINDTIARYRTQFAQLDSMIANMNSTSSYLTQQFDNMNAQLGKN